MVEQRNAYLFPFAMHVTRLPTNHEHVVVVVVVVVVDGVNGFPMDAKFRYERAFVWLNRTAN